MSGFEEKRILLKKYTTTSHHELFAFAHLRLDNTQKQRGSKHDYYFFFPFDSVSQLLITSIESL